MHTGGTPGALWEHSHACNVNPNLARGLAGSFWCAAALSGPSRDGPGPLSQVGLLKKRCDVARRRHLHQTLVDVARIRYSPTGSMLYCASCGPLVLARAFPELPRGAQPGGCSSKRRRGVGKGPLVPEVALSSLFPTWFDEVLRHFWAAGAPWGLGRDDPEALSQVGVL